MIMMHDTLCLRKLLLGLVLLVTCTLIVASSSSRERRHVGVEESSHRPGRIHTPGSRSFKSATSKNNEITAEPGRKVSHRLIGGHLRVDTKSERNEPLWDDGILMSSAGNGKEGKTNRGEDDDEKKTLSQQVKEGKYGLIQDEIYKKQPKRPGIISYLGNPEVPKDTIENLGGLEEDEIWLAENHVLVLRGGKFPGHEVGQGNAESKQTWPAIDNYKAPRRQVKIPPKPKVPPPFPVQLTEGGPVQIIGPNGTTEIGNGTLDYRKDPLYGKGLLPGDGPLFAIISNGTILMPDYENPKNVSVEEKSLIRNQERIKSELPPTDLPPFYHAIPPGAVFVPPPSNQSDYDEEDQSIYYPPPYSFHYQQDNTTAVPPGPLVPGIILPPPPDFFSALDDKKTTTKKYTKRPDTTPLPRLRPTYLPPRKLTTKQYKTPTTVPSVEAKTNVILPVSTKVYGRTRYRNSTKGTPRSSFKTVPQMEITTPTPDKQTTVESTELYNIGSVVKNQVSESSQEKSQSWSGLVPTKTLPIVAYYATTPSTLERPVEVTPASIKNIVTTSSPGRSTNQASYYFYEESNDESTITTPSPTSLYYRTTTESPYFKVETRSRPEERKKQYYSVETIPSQETSKDYSIKFIDSLIKNSPVYGYDDSEVTQTSSKYDNNHARIQNQRMLSDRAPIYYQAISARPSAAVQSPYTTPKPQTYYRPDTKPKPIYQYSFEAADYSKRGNQRNRYKQQQQSISYNEYQEIKTNRPHYDYDDVSVPEKRLRPESVSYKPQQPVYPSTTPSTVISTTPNPHQTFFTQQDEKLLDDVTKEYFTIFGKKLSNNGIPSTTPIYGKANSVTERPNYNVNTYVQNYDANVPPVYKTPNVKVYYGDQAQRPYSLKDDTLVNYRQPLPPINPDSEFITVVEPKPQQPPLQRYRIQTTDYRQNQENQALTPIHGYTPQEIIEPGNGPSTNYVPIIDSREEIDESYQQRPLSLEDDIEVNYRDPRPTINPDAEYIDPIPVHDTPQENPKAYFAYRLPGDGGHFYFLTPQAITQRPQQNAGYLYPKSRGTRLLRRRRRPGNV